MGSTVAALIVQEGFFSVLWVGDSRVYLFRDGTLHQLSRDHTQVQEMVDSGLLTPDEAKTHPMSHVLARAVGVQASLELDVIVDEAGVGDRFLLCSDGLTARVSPEEIAAAMAGVPAEIVQRQLGHFHKADPHYADGVAKALGVTNGVAGK